MGDIKGFYHETCASEGHCPYYFGRDKEGGCRYFMVFRVTEGEVAGADLAGITAVYLGDLPHSTYAEVAEKGSEGAIYITDNATPDQRAVLDTLTVKSLGGVLMRKVLGVHYVNVEVNEEAGRLRVTMPSGEMSMEMTKSRGGQPVRLENVTMPFLSNVRAAHAPYWRWADHDRHYEYRNRCATWADFQVAWPPK
jgi:hypothetical protein